MANKISKIVQKSMGKAIEIKLYNYFEKLSLFWSY